MSTTTTRIICLGEILFDCLADQMGRELFEVASWTEYPGGAPANVACALSKLGNAAAFVGCVGQDQPGDRLVSVLKGDSVDVSGIQRSSQAPTRKVYVTRSLKGDRCFAGFGEFDSSQFADTQLTAADMPKSLFADAEFLVIGTLELAYPNSRQATLAAIRLARENQVKIFIDVNWRPVFWDDSEVAKSSIMTILEQADLIKCTDEEAQWLFGMQDPAAIAKLFPQAEGVLVTAGEKGCAYSLGEHTGEVDIFPIMVVDTTGAGDSFVAGFLHYFCRQRENVLANAKSARDAVVYASAVGALTTMKPGAIAAQPTAKEVDDFLKLQPATLQPAKLQAIAA
ncbi:MAG: carbohydrate kinase [Phormidesmis sp.]